MKIEKSELISIISQYNPWWKGDSIQDLPSWQRASFGEVMKWVLNPPAKRAVLLSGARQVGKTTLLMQAIQTLLDHDVPAGNILYATFDHPIIKLSGIDAVLEAWREREPKADGPEYLFIDEAQFIKEWGTWVKHQVDFNKQRRIIFTGSAMPMITADQESGVGRWHAIQLTTLSFYEYLKIKNIKTPALPQIGSLRDITTWSEKTCREASERGRDYIAHFHNYLLLGGFPQTALIEHVSQAQKLLREDIIDKAIKRDMTALFGVRHVLELEQIFLYFCLHDGGIMDMPSIQSNLGINRQTAQRFVDFLVSSHLIYKLQRFGYGKEVLRGKNKIYLADAAIPTAVMLKGTLPLNDPTALGVAAESAVLKHLFARYYKGNVRFTYWQGKKGLEVDLVAELGSTVIPFEVKYKNHAVTRNDVRGLSQFCTEKGVNRGYIVTKEIDDLGSFALNKDIDTPIMTRIPAPLLCYWMGELELRDQSLPD